ncbi:MAG: lytic murein transglycosylase B [Xanthomonadales bacterium]|nr:lytic murein transglycosylase B [Xanthomonadales bacterium]
MPRMTRTLLAVFLSASTTLAAAPLPGQDAFVAEVAAETGMAPALIEAVLAGARKQQSILDAISRPAEAKPWRDYRPIFLTQARIDGGRRFMREHRDLLARTEAATGVPAEVVTAIIGVETSYGAITGRHRVLDALVTLGFHYPPRADFFRSELKHLFHLVREEEHLDIRELRGSYAGAMGWGQFIPSSYRAYAVDGDGDGRRDLFDSLPDIVASVANYFVAHGWERDGLVTLPARSGPDTRPFERDGLRLNTTLGGLRELGWRVDHEGGDGLAATLLRLDGASGEEHWVLFNNFYVITRYNRSPLYAMAVHQLTQALAAPGVSGAP